MKIAFIGGGNMGEAMASAVIGRKIVGANDVTVSDVGADRRKYLSDKYHVATTDNNAVAVTNADVVVLAVKPQSLPSVLPGLNGKLKASQLVISIIAGATVDKLEAGLGHNCLIRTMPNTPAQIGEGVTVWLATPGVNTKQKEMAKAIMSVMGKEIEVSDEDYLNMATAVSGSGPAYVFLFMEALEKAARDIGLPPEIARELTFRTVLGSAKYAEQSGRDLADLRRAVTSPGGTTAEALAVFEKGNFTGLIGEAVKAACEKSRILGKQ
jgi:pyrroline-5-carboxylate reductase